MGNKECKMLIVQFDGKINKINWFVCKISEEPVLEFYKEPLQQLS